MLFFLFCRHHLQKTKLNLSHWISHFLLLPRIGLSTSVHNKPGRTSEPAVTPAASTHTALQTRWEETSKAHGNRVQSVIESDLKEVCPWEGGLLITGGQITLLVHFKCILNDHISGLMGRMWGDEKKNGAIFWLHKSFSSLWNGSIGN